MLISIKFLYNIRQIMQAKKISTFFNETNFKIFFQASPGCSFTGIRGVSCIIIPDYICSYTYKPYSHGNYILQ